MTTDAVGLSVYAGDIISGVATVVTVVTAWIMWGQLKEQKKADSATVQHEKQELLAIQLNAVQRRLDDCEKRHHECEDRFNRLQRENFDLMRYLFTPHTGGGGHD